MRTWTWSGLAPRDRRALLVGALILAPALLVTFVVRPYLRAMGDLRGRVMVQAELLHRELGLVADARALPGWLVREDRTLASVRPRLVNARDPLAATAALVTLVGEAARRHGVFLEAVESRPPTSLESGIVAVQVTARGRGDFEGVLRWLRGLETGPTLVRVEQVELARVGGIAQTTTRDARDMETLAVAASVRAYFLSGSGGSGPAGAVAFGREGTP